MKKLKLDIQRFSSTNKTTNYDLPQFVGTDKPTWLGDVNEAMASIDAGMHKNASDISTMASDVASASATASQASQDVAGLTSTVNTISSNVTAVTTTANNAQQTATSALNTANTANGKADTNASNITTIQSDITTMQSNINSNTTKINGLGGQILWTNPNPTAPFSTLTINLSSSDYDMYMILFENNTSGAMINSSVSLKGYGTQLINSIGSTTIRRLVDYSSNTQLNVREATGEYSSTSSVIPLYVIGYKTNLFS